MHRTQLLLEEWQYQALRAQAEREGRSLSSLVREILARHLARRPARRKGRLEHIEGVAEGPANLGRDHDDFLYGKRRRKRK